MSEQHLFKFQQESDYKLAKKNHLILPNISKVVESGNTYINTKFATKETTEAGDIIVYHEDETTGEVTVKYMKPEAFDKNDEYWTADSIVVVPFKHTNDGTVRAMALNYASVTNPSEGGNGEIINTGAGVVGSEMKLYGDFIVFSWLDEQTINDSYGLSETGNIPSDAIESEKLNPFDRETFYSNNSTMLIPSPYNNDGSMSDAYHSKGDFVELTRNGLQDMNGKENTEIMLSLASVQDVYAQTINNVDTSYPSAIACARYSSVLKPCVFDQNKTVAENLATMPWYQPSIGEIGYYMSRKARIDYALQQVGKTLPDGNIKISSSTFGQTGLVNAAVETADGTMTYFDNTEQLFVVPFCKY